MHWTCQSRPTSTGVHDDRRQIAYPKAILDQIKGKHVHVCEVMTCVWSVRIAVPLLPSAPKPHVQRIGYRRFLEIFQIESRGTYMQLWSIYLWIYVRNLAVFVQTTFGSLVPDLRHQVWQPHIDIKRGIQFNTESADVDPPTIIDSHQPFIYWIRRSILPREMTQSKVPKEPDYRQDRLLEARIGKICQYVHLLF